MADKDHDALALETNIGKLQTQLADAYRQREALTGRSTEQAGTIDFSKVDGTVELDSRPPPPPRSTVFSYLSFDALPDKGVARALLLTVEALIYVGASLVIARFLGVEESGVFSICLSSAVLSPRLMQLLEENRRRIWEIGYKSWKTNILTAGSITAIFLGTIIAYVVAAVWLESADVLRIFRFALHAAGLGTDSILTRRFDGFLPIFSHNFIVLWAVVCISFIYRTYGALVAIVWNACVWGLVLTFLVRRGLSVTEGSSVGFIATSIGAIFPHLLLEGGAYVVAAMASIFFSQALMKYPVTDERFRIVAFASVRLFTGATALLLLAALFETQLAPWLLGTLK